MKAGGGGEGQSQAFLQRCRYHGISNMYSLVIICDGWGGGLRSYFAGVNLPLMTKNHTHTLTHSLTYSKNCFAIALQQAQLCIINATFYIVCDFVSPPTLLKISSINCLCHSEIDYLQ